MEKLKVSFHIRNGVLNVCVSLNGQRGHKVVKGLINPNRDKWDSDHQAFIGKDKDTHHNNTVLLETLKRCQQIIEARNPATVKELLDLYSNGGVEACKSKTCGSYLLECIKDMKTGKNNKLRSNNHKNYTTLFNKLQREGNIINTPLSEIENRHLIQFSNYLLCYERRNYEKPMKTFKALHAKARNNGLNNNSLVYKFMDNNPLPTTETRKALTIKEYQDFENFDLSLIKYKGKNPKELLFDALILLKETKSRPVDVISFHTDQIENINGTDFIVYIPAKKKGYRGDQRVYVPITDKARSIIDKYAGKSKEGYILPFIMNDTKCDKTNQNSFDKWNSDKDHVERQMGAILKSICPFIGVDPIGIVPYVIRHTALTHAAQ
jgi:integrase